MATVRIPMKQWDDKIAWAVKATWNTRQNI